MIAPGICSRIKQTNQFTVDKRRKIWPFEKIAPMAGKTKVVDLIASAMLPSDNVLNMK